MLSAEEIRALLQLRPHPAEGGFFAETYRSEERIGGEALPPRYGGPRAFGKAIYYLVTHDTFSAIHRLASDELFPFYLGDPVEMLQLFPDGSGRVITLGPDLLGGMPPPGDRAEGGLAGRAAGARRPRRAPGDDRLPGVRLRRLRAWPPRRPPQQPPSISGPHPFTDIGPKEVSPLNAGGTSRSRGAALMRRCNRRLRVVGDIHHRAGRSVQILQFLPMPAAHRRLAWRLAQHEVPINQRLDPFSTT